LPKLHAAGGHPGSICMRQAAKWQRRALPLAARCKLNLYVTGCRLGTFCMRLAAIMVPFACGRLSNGREGPCRWQPACKLNLYLMTGCRLGTLCMRLAAILVPFACGTLPKVAEKDLAAGSPVQAQFVCDWLPPWYF
jgi:hypothetical protein